MRRTNKLEEIKKMETLNLELSIQVSNNNDPATQLYISPSETEG
jgi:hypothetical protein